MKTLKRFLEKIGSVELNDPHSVKEMVEKLPERIKLLKKFEKARSLVIGGIINWHKEHAPASSWGLSTSYAPLSYLTTSLGFYIETLEKLFELLKIELRRGVVIADKSLYEKLAQKGILLGGGKPMSDFKDYFGGKKFTLWEAMLDDISEAEKLIYKEYKHEQALADELRRLEQELG